MSTDTDPTSDEQYRLPADFETTEHVTRTDTGASIKITMTRGTGTRDQDRLEGKVKAPTVEQAKADVDELFPKLCRLAEAARAFDPSIDTTE
ncbi:DUF7389 domain-containing protein [Haloarchaeobius amylolyticus]|uniref:DUF7389 domain-containing protein n=1 Tax=Haloarchaeobius amylolyticus TaxID=1198296 RepID=UPI00226F6118|nr:hypothetical protein [Haloarchaeobius amylolyticus]